MVHPAWMTSSGKFVLVAETTSGKLTFILRQSDGKPGASSRHPICACGNRIDVIAALDVGEHVDPSEPLVVAVKNRIDHVRKIAQLHRERFRLRTRVRNFRDRLLGQVGHWDFSGHLRSNRATAASVRSTLLGEAGWHRADFAEARTLDDGPNL